MQSNLWQGWDLNLNFLVPNGCPTRCFISIQSRVPGSLNVKAFSLVCVMTVNFFPHQSGSVDAFAAKPNQSDTPLEGGEAGRSGSHPVFPSHSLLWLTLCAWICRGEGLLLPHRVTRHWGQWVNCCELLCQSRRRWRGRLELSCLWKDGWVSGSYLKNRSNKVKLWGLISPKALT